MNWTTTGLSDPKLDQPVRHKPRRKPFEMSPNINDLKSLQSSYLMSNMTFDTVKWGTISSILYTINRGAVSRSQMKLL